MTFEDDGSELSVGILTPLGYSWSTNWALTHSPVWVVVVVRM